jgi:hypothetical protein
LAAVSLFASTMSSNSLGPVEAISTQAGNQRLCPTGMILTSSLSLLVPLFSEFLNLCESSLSVSESELELDFEVTSMSREDEIMSLRSSNSKSI